MHGLNEVQTFGNENEVRPQSDDLLETRIDRAAYFGFFLSIGGIIAVIGVSNQAILQSKGVDRFCKTRRERDNALDGLRDANGAACFIDDILIKGRSCRALGRRLRLQPRTPPRRRTEQQRSGASHQNIFSCVSPCWHKSPRQKQISCTTKKPRETPWGFLA